MKVELERVAGDGNGIFGLEDQEMLGRVNVRAPWCPQHCSALGSKPGKIVLRQ